jgi:hypothetical protein
VAICGYVPSCQDLNDVASHEPDGHSACQVSKSPWVVRRVCKDQLGGKVLSIQDWGGGQGLLGFVHESTSF